MSLSCRSVPLVLALAVSSVLAEDILPMPEAPNAARDQQSVYVRDSGVASERLALAERMEKLGEWDKAAEVYQEIIEKYPDRVVPRNADGAGPAGPVTEYMSVTLLVQEKLAQWPPQGIETYRRRFEDTARERLEAAPAGDPAALQAVLNHYLPTDAGKQAGLQLMADSFERGEFASSAWVGRRLLKLHPALRDAERAGVLFQTALAEHLAGDAAQAQARLEELQTRHPDAIAPVAGQETRLAEALAKALATPSGLVRTFRSDSWPMPFGTPDASAVPEQVSTGGARLFGIEVGALPDRLNRGGRTAQYMQYAAAERRLGSMTGILPSIDSGELFFQDNARIYAINLASGLPLTGWQQTYPGEKRGSYSIDALPLPPGRQFAVHVTADRLVAVLGQADPQMGAMVNVAPQQPPTLVCLDRSSGKRIWGTALGKLKVPDDQAALREGAFYGTPLVDGDHVYTLVRAQRGGQFEECHLVSLRLADGSYEWSTYIASTATGNRFLDIESDTVGTGATAQLSASDGRLYVLTNLGAVACIDAAGGHTLWLNIYARAGGEAGWMPRGGGGRRFIQPPRTIFKPYAVNPPIISDGRLFVLPTDSPSLFVYDATTGEPLAEVPRRVELPRQLPEERNQTIDMLLAVMGDTLIGGNRRTIVKVPWRKYDPQKNLVDNGGMYRNFLGGEGDDADAIRGRPFVSSEFILVPTANKLMRMTVDQFTTKAEYPASGKWDEEEQPGNVLATPDHLIIAGPTRVTAYADLAVATGKLDVQIRQSPEAVEPYLRYAELLLAGGKPADAIGYIDKAIERLGGAGNLRQGELRDRLFEICCSFAIKLQRTAAALSGSAAPSLKSPEAIVIRQLYDRARDAAASPQQQVRYRLALGSFLRTGNDAAGELALHQEILAEPEWRTAPVAGTRGASTAGTEAEQAIGELIQRHGAQIYASYEARAGQALSRAEVNESVGGEQLVAIADEYPTAAATTRALALAAERFEPTQPRLAAQTLRRLLKRDLPESRRLAALESLARTYLATPGQLDTAIVRLQQAARINGSATLSRPLTLPDGRVLEKISYAAAQQMVHKYRADAIARSLPILGIAPTSTAADPTAPGLLPPVEVASATAIVDQQADVARHDRVVAYSARDGGILQIPVGQKDPRPPVAPFEEAPVGCAYSGKLLVVVGPTRIMGVAADDNQELWRVSLADLPGAEVAPPPDEPDAAEAAGEDGIPLLDQRPRIILNNNRMRAILQLDAGEGGDDAAVAGGGAERITGYRVLSDRLVIGTSSGRIVSVELSSGKTAWQTRPSELPVWHFLAGEDFVVASYSDRNNNLGLPGAEVVVMDAITGRITLRDTYGAGGPRDQLVNLALSGDGVLVSLLPRSIRARDLYDLKTPEWKQENVGNPMNHDMPFSLSGGPRQLVISDDRVLVIFRSNTGTQSVRAYSLRDGLKPLRTRDEKTNREVEVSYSPRGRHDNADNLALSIRAVGPAFYIYGQKSLAAYHLDNEQWQWSPRMNPTQPVARDFLLAQDVAILLTNPPAVPNPVASRLPAVQLMMYSRELTPDGVESGVLERRPKLADNGGILVGQWQVANGAFYYVTGDQKLKMAAVAPAAGEAAP